MKNHLSLTVQRALEKWPVSRRTETVSRFYSAADFSGTNHPSERPKPGPDKAFHNPAPCVFAIRGWRANHGLCSSRAVEALQPGLPATSLSSRGVFSPAGRSDFSGCPSRAKTLNRKRRKIVFTHTQIKWKLVHFDACILEREMQNGVGHELEGQRTGARPLAASAGTALAYKGRRNDCLHLPGPHYIPFSSEGGCHARRKFWHRIHTNTSVNALVAATGGVFFAPQNFFKNLRDIHPNVTVAPSASLVNQPH